MLKAFKVMMTKALETNQYNELFQLLFSNSFIETVYGDIKAFYRDFLVTSLILDVAYILALGLRAISSATERKEGLLERSLICEVAKYLLHISSFMVFYFCPPFLELLI